MNAWVILAIAGSLTGPGFAAPAPGADEGRSQFERALETNVNRLLDEVLGPRQARVFLTATLDQSTAGEPVDRLLARYGRAEELPGFRQPSIVQRFSVRIVEDPGLGAERARAAEDLVRQVLGISSERGDELAVIRAPLRETWSKTLDHPGLRGALASGLGIFILAASLVLLAALAARRTAVLAMRQIHSEQPRPPTAPLVGPPPLPNFPPIPFATSPPAPYPSPPPAPLASPPRFVDSPPKAGQNRAIDIAYLCGPNLRLVARFLGIQGPAAARSVLRSLDSDTAAALFRLLPASISEDTACALAQGEADKPPPEELRRVADDLREFLNEETKGPGLLREILVRSPDPFRQSVLDGVKRRAPEALRRIEKGLLRFEDLDRADSDSLARLAKETTSEELATALRGSPPSLQDRLLTTLPEGLRLNAERRLRESSSDETDTMRARAAVLSRWKYLEASGKVRPL